MQTAWKQAALMTVVASIAAVLIGCNRPVERADRSVNSQLAEAAKDLPSKPEKAITVFQKAATVSGASLAAQSQARLELANAEVRAADHLIFGLSPAPGKGKELAEEGVEQIDSRIVALCVNLNAQAARVQANNVAIAGLRQLEPKAAQEAFKKVAAAVVGGPDSGTWISADSGPIPSQAGVDAQLATLQQKIDALQKQEADLKAQRLTDQQQAEQLRNQSETATGRKSVELFTQSSSLRKTAADLTTQLDGLDAQLATLNQDLLVAQAQKKQLGNAVQAFQTQQDQLAAGWKQAQGLILALAQSSQNMLGGAGAATAPAADTSAPAAAPSAFGSTDIATLSDSINELASKGDVLRKKAIDYLQKALKDYDQAALANKNFATPYTNQLSLPDARGYPQAAAWQMLLEIHNASDVKLQQSEAWLRLSQIYADWAITTAAQTNAAKAVQKAVDAGNVLLDGLDVKLTVPASINAAELDTTYASAHEKAEDAYDKADKLLHDVIASPANNPFTKNARDVARAVQLVAYYGRSKFESAVGDAANSSKWLTESKRSRDTMVTDNVRLPSPLPMEISLAPAVPATFNINPTRAPASGPTTLPNASTAPVTQSSAFGGAAGAKPDSRPATAPEQQ